MKSNRISSQESSKALFWCDICDADLVGNTGKCGTCGAKAKKANKNTLKGVNLNKKELESEIKQGMNNE